MSCYFYKNLVLSFISFQIWWRVFYKGLLDHNYSAYSILDLNYFNLFTVYFYFSFECFWIVDQPFANFLNIFRNSYSSSQGTFSFSRILTDLNDASWERWTFLNVEGSLWRPPLSAVLREPTVPCWSSRSLSESDSYFFC